MRLFVAIELPGDVKDRLSLLQDDLERTGAPFKAVRRNNLHITLKFLGNAGENAAARIQSLLEETALSLEPFELSFRGTGVFPSRRRPLVAWAGVIDRHGRLRRLRSEVEETLSHAGFQREKQPFSPHVTVARIKKGAKRCDAEKIIPWLETTGDADSGSMEVRGISLFQSILSAEGASYRLIAAAGFHESA